MRKKYTYKYTKKKKKKLPTKERRAGNYKRNMYSSLCGKQVCTNIH